MKAPNPHVLVTGGAGFIGRHVVEALVRQDTQVSVLDGTGSEAPDNVRSVSLDMHHDDFAAHLDSERYSAIVHLSRVRSVAASIESPYEDFEDSLHVTLKLLEILRNSSHQPRLIIASSEEVYGNPVTLPMTETDIAHPISPFGVANLAMERYAAVYSQLYMISTASLRFFSVYGPDQQESPIYDLISQLHNHPTTLTLQGTGAETRDFIHVRDAAQAILTILASAPMMGEIYNIATGVPHSTREVAQTIAEILDITPDIECTGQIGFGASVRWYANIEKIRQLGFTPQIDLADGIQEMVARYRETDDSNDR